MNNSIATRHTKFVGILLAAGQSVRMGRTKQLLPWGDRTILEATLQHYLDAGLDDITVVVGSDAERVRAALAPYAVSTVLNPHFTEGMGTSLRAGIQALPPGWQAVVIGLGDQPTLAPATIRSVIAAYGQDDRSIVAPTFGGRRGHPVILGHRFMNEFDQLSGDVGCRGLLAAHPREVCEVAVDDPGVILDIDTPDDYEHALALRREA